MDGQVQPIIILKEGTRREHGRTAQESNFEAARAIADAVKTTLGPRGMDKMLVDTVGEVTITNDGATILGKMDVAHPAAKMLIEVAKTQDEECGDGTKTAVILTGELLRGAQDLVAQDVHPAVVSEGFREARDTAIRHLQGMATPLSPGDRKTLSRVARTALASKIAQASADVLAPAAIDACLAVTETVGARTRCDIDNVRVRTVTGGGAADTRLVRGLLLAEERIHAGMPPRVAPARIALLDLALEVKKTETSAEIEITAPAQLQAFLDQEEAYVKGLVDRVVASGANAVFCEKGVDDLAQHTLAKAGVYTVRRVKRSDLDLLAKATGGKLLSTLDDLDAASLGHADAVAEEKYGDKKLTAVTGCRHPRAVSILLRGSTEHFVGELERALHDTLSVVAVALEDLKVLPGGGAWAVETAKVLKGRAPTVGGRAQLALEAFATALESIPRILAENAGLDEIDVLLALRQAHQRGEQGAGINVMSGKVEDMAAAGVVEPLRVAIQEIDSATEAATMLLRIDDVIATKRDGSAPSREV